MIQMTIHNGEEVQQRELPCDFLSLRMSMYQMNLMRAPSEVSVQDVQDAIEKDQARASSSSPAERRWCL